MEKNNPHHTWLRPPDDLDLHAHRVDIWRVSLDLSTETLRFLESSLSADELHRAARFHFSSDRDRFIAAHGCLRGILARYFHSEPGQLSFSTGSHGKPAIDLASSERGVEFSLSHSGDVALVAVAGEQKVGVDVERIRQGISAPVIARQYFSKSEVAELLALPSEHREVGFFNCWTRKEAYIKAQGFGLSLPLESFDVSLSPNEPAILRATRPDPEESARWTLQHLNVYPGYAAALASEGSVKMLNSWDWDLRVHS